MPKILKNPFRNNLSVEGLTLRHDELLDQPVLTTSDVRFNSLQVGNLTANGTIFFTGNITEVETTHLVIRDNIIDINKDNDIPLLKGGFSIHRGPGLSPFDIIYDENTQLLRLGFDDNLQAVATRQDDPQDGYPVIWNAVMRRFDTTSEFSGEISFTNDLIARKKIIFEPFGLSTNSSPYITSSSSGNLHLHSKEDIILGASDVPIGKSIIIPFGRKISFSLNSHMYTNPSGDLILDALNINFSNLTKITWGSLASLYTNNQGTDLAVKGSIVSFEPTTSVKISNSNPFIHADILKMQPVTNGGYSMTTTGDLYLTSGTLSDVIVPSLSFNKQVRLVSDVNGNLNVDSMGEIFLSPNKNIIISPGKSLCFSNESSCILVSNDGNLRLNHPESIILNASKSVIIPLNTTLKISNNTSIYETNAGLTTFSSTHDILIAPGDSRSVMIPSGISLTFGEGETVTSNDQILTLIARQQIVLNAALGIKIPQNIPILFGDTEHSIYQDVAKNLCLKSTLQIVLSSSEKVVLDTDVISLGTSNSKSFIYRDTDNALAFDSGALANHVKSISNFLVENNDEATDFGTASLMTNGGVFVGKNLIVKNETQLLSKVNIANTVTVSDDQIPILISNSSENNGTGIGFTSRWDFTGGYTIGRGTPDVGNGRSMMFSLPPFTTYGIGTVPNFFFGSANGNPYMILSNTGLDLQSGTLYVANLQDDALTIMGGAVINGPVVLAETLNVANNSLKVSPTNVTVSSQLLVENALYGKFDNGNQNLFSMDTTGNVFFLDSAFKRSVVVDGNITIKGQVRFDNSGLTLGGDLDVQSHRLINLPDPQNDSDAATKLYVDSFLRGMSAKEAVMAASTDNIDLQSPVYNIDNVSLENGDRVLLKDQINSVENGIYEVDATNMLTRANDVYPGTDVSGSSVFVSSGDSYGSIGFVVVGNPVIVDTDSMNWTPFTGASQISVGSGLSKTGNTFYVNVDSFSLRVNGNNALEISPNYISSIGLSGGTGGIPLSTSTDQSHVTKVGDIISGSWKANAISVSHGGTGSTSLRKGSLLMGNGIDAITSVENIVIDGTTGNVGFQTNVPRSNLHVSNLPNTNSGTWLRLEDTSPLMTQSSGILINTANNNAKVSLRSDGSLYIGQEDFTNSSSISLATQRTTRLSIDSTGNVVIGNNPTINGNILSVHGNLAATGKASIDGDLSLPSLTITKDSLGNTVFESQLVKFSNGFDVTKDSTIGNFKFVSTVSGETSLISLDRNTSLGLPLRLKTSNTNTSAVCINDGFLIPGRLQIGGQVGDTSSGFTILSVNNNLHFTPGIAGAGVLFNAPMSFGEGLSLYDRSKSNDFITMHVSGTSLYLRSKTTTVISPYNFIIGGGTNEIITTLTNKSSSATIKYDPTDTLEYGGGVLSVSPSILTTFGSEVRLMDIMRFNLGNSTEGVLGNAGWYYLGKLGIGRTTLSASLSWRIRLDYDGVSNYNLSILSFDRNVASLVIYRDENNSFHIFLKVLSGPCRLSIIESPVRLYLSQYEGGGATPNGQYSGYTISWSMDLNSSEAQSNANLEFGSINVLGASTLHNATLNGQTVLSGSLQVNGSSNFFANDLILSDPVTSLPKISMKTDDDNVSNVIVLHGADDTSPAVVFDRSLVNGSIGMVPSTSSKYADALLISHNSNNSSSQIVLSTRGIPSLLVDNSGSTTILSTLDSLNTESVSLKVKGGMIVDKRALFKNALYSSQLCVLNSTSGAFIPIVCDNDLTLNVNESRISGVADPINQGDAVNMRYVQGLIQGLSAKDSVKAASANVNVDLTLPLNSLDDVALSPGNRILLKNQTNPVENGIYIVVYGEPPIRASDLDVGDHAAATFVFVSQGLTNANSGWICSTTPGEDVVGVNAISFTQFSGAGQFNAGAGLAKIGSTIQVLVDGVSLEIANNNLRVKSSIAGEGLTGGSGSPLSVSSIMHLDTLGTIRNGTWNGGVIGMAYGGTGLNNISVGRIPFSNGISLSQGALYFDEINVRLGINTISPMSGLTLQDRDIQLHQTVANTPYILFSSSVTNHTFSLRNESSKFILSSGTGVNKLALNDILSVDNFGVLSVTNSVKSGTLLLGNATRVSAKTIESLTSGPFSMSMFSLDNSGTFFNIYGGLGTANNNETSELMRLGYYNGGYIIQTSSTGIGVARNLCLQAGTNTNQFVLQPNGNAVFNAPLYINSTSDAKSGIDGGALTVLGGGAFNGDVYVKRLISTSDRDDSILTNGGIRGTRFTITGAFQDYDFLSDSSGALILSGKNTNTESLLHLSSKDADNASDVFLRIFGLGYTESSTSEWLQLGYERNNSVYGLRMLHGGAASHRSLILSATKDLDQVVLKPDGSVAFFGSVSSTGAVNITNTQEATSASSSSSASLSVSGGASITKSLYVGNNIQVPKMHISDAAVFSSSGSTDNIHVNYTSLGQLNVYNNTSTTVNIHTGNSLGPKSPNQEKLIIGHGSATHHLIQSIGTGTGITKDLVLTVGNHTDQLRLYASNGSLSTSGDFHVASTSDSISSGTGALQVSGGLSVKKSSNFSGSINVGSGSPGILLSLKGASSWEIHSPDANTLRFRSSSQNSTFSFADVEGSDLLSIDTQNKSCKTSVPVLIKNVSTHALTIQNNSFSNLFSFDTVNHLFDMSGGRLVNLGYPQIATDGATKSYVDNLIKGLNLKAAARVASSTNIDLTRVVTVVDGIAVQPGWRILLMFQTNAVENGIYVVGQSGLLTRADDLSQGSRAAGAFCFVEMGEYRGDKGYVCIADFPNDVVGTHALSWTQFNGNIISAGKGLIKDGNNVLNINLDPTGSGLSFDGNYVRIDPTFAGSGLQMNSGILSLSPITSVDTIVSGTWQGTSVALPYGGTGNNHFPMKHVVFSDGTKLTSSNKFMWDNDLGCLGINSSPNPTNGGDGITVKDLDVCIHGRNAGLYMADETSIYNWGIRRSLATNNNQVRGIPVIYPWKNTIMSKDGNVLMVTSEPGSKDFLSTNKGYTWEEFLKDNIPHVWGEIVMSFDGSVILACASEEYLFVSNDGGKTFTRSVTDFPRIWEWCSISDNGQYMLASALADGMFASNDSGQTWRLVPEVPTDPVDLGFVHVCKDGQKQYAGYFGGPLFESTDYGVSFVQRTDIRDGSYYDICEARDSNTLVLFEEPGSIFVSTDLGVTWNERLSDTQRRWVFASISPDGSSIATADHSGSVWFSSDFGVTWKTLFNGLVALWNFVLVSDDNMGVIAGGSNVPIHVTKDGGETFSQVTDRNINTPMGTLSPAGLFYYVEYQGSAYRYTFVPSTNLVISSGSEVVKSNLKDFVVMTDRNQMGVGYTSQTSGNISNTLDINGTLHVSSHVHFENALSTASGGTGTKNLPYGLVIANGESPFTSTQSFPSGGVAVGALDGSGKIVIESGATLRSTLGLSIGNHVQAWNSNLDDISGLSPINGYFIMGNGSQFVMGTAEAAANSMGLGRLAYLDNVNNTYWNGEVLSVNNGGTGSNTFANNTIPFYNGNNLTNSNMVYDSTKNGFAINGPEPLGSGLCLYASDVQLLSTSTNDSDLTWNNSDDTYAWRIRKQTVLDNDTNFVISGGISGQNKDLLIDHLKIASSGEVSILQTSNATSVDSGALRINGGVSVVKNIFSAGQLIISNTLESDSINSGAIIVNGGVSVGKTLRATDVNFTGNVTFTSTIDATSSTAAGTLISGGIGLTGKLWSRESIIIDKSLGIGNRAAGLTVGYNAAGWTSGTSINDSDKHLSLVSNLANSAVTFSMKNLLSPQGWDIVVEGSGENRMIFQNSTGVSWLTLSATSGNIVLSSTSTSSITTGGGIVCGKGISCTGLSVNGSSTGEISASIINTNSDNGAFSALRLGNNDSLKNTIIFFNSTSRTVDGGAGTCTFRNDAGAIRIQGANSSGLTVSSTGNIALDGTLTVKNVTDASSTTNGGSATISGGLAVSKSTFIGGNLNVSGSANIAGAVSSPLVSVSAEISDLANVTSVTVKGTKLTIINNQYDLRITFKVVPTASSYNTEFAFILPGRSTNFVESLDMDTGQCSGFTDSNNYIVLMNTLCTAIPGSTKAKVKFQSVDTNVHYLQVFVSYAAV